MKINAIKFVKYISLKTNYNKKIDDFFVYQENEYLCKGSPWQD